MMAKSFERRIIEEELSKLLDFARDNEISEEKIAELAEHSYEEYKNKYKKVKGLSLNFRFLSFLFVLLAICVALGFSTNFFSVSARIGLLKLRNLYDWTTFYNHSCILENPFYSTPVHDNKTCDTCNGLLTIEKINNASAREILNDNIINNKPIIVSDALRDDWEAKTLFDLSFIFEIFTKNEKLKSALPCVMHTNKKRNKNNKVDTISDLILLLSHQDGGDDSWFAYWENCNKNAMRTLRKYYKRPYFVHPSVEIAHGNWIMISTNYNAENYINTDFGTAVTWFVQMKGSTHISLRPINCDNICKDLYAVVHEGDTVLWTQPYWQFAYGPSGSSGDNVAMMFGGFIN